MRTRQQCVYMCASLFPRQGSDGAVAICASQRTLQQAAKPVAQGASIACR
jgi:hypothetical protein